MWDEDQSDFAIRRLRQALADLGPMAVSASVIGHEVVRRLGKREMQLGLATGTAHAGFGIGDEMVAVDDTAFDEREEAELHRRRITAGIRHQPGAANSLAVHLAQAVDRFAHQLGRRVLHLVPALPFDDVAETEVGRKVNDARPGFEHRARFAHRHAVRRGEEDDIATAQRLRARIGEGEPDVPTQPGEHRGNGRTCFLARRDGAKLDFGMLDEQAQELYARIARATDNAYFDHVLSPKNKKAARRRLSISGKSSDQRFEYCLRRLALCSPTFFRSTSRAARVTRPAALSVLLSAAPYSMSAREMP